MSWSAKIIWCVRDPFSIFREALQTALSAMTNGEWEMENEENHPA
jgi:hypothetical protein